MTSDIADRPLSLAKRLPAERAGWDAVASVLFGVAALGGLLGACARFTAPVVMSAWRVRETAQPVPGARVSEGKCGTKLVLTSANGVRRGSAATPR